MKWTISYPRWKKKMIHWCSSRCLFLFLLTIWKITDPLEMSPYAQGCFGGVFWHVDYLFCGEYSELHRMLNAGVSVDFINTKAAIRGSAWHRQTEQLRTLHPNNYRRLYRDLAWDCFFGGVYLYFFLLWTICSAECLGVFFAAAVMLWGETFTLVLWISLAVAKCFVYSPGGKKNSIKAFLEL